MPSFDIVSKADLSSVLNAIDGVQREINTRYDFKGSQSKVEFDENIIDLRWTFVKLLYCMVLHDYDIPWSWMWHWYSRIPTGH